MKPVKPGREPWQGRVWVQYTAECADCDANVCEGRSRPYALAFFRRCGWVHDRRRGGWLCPRHAKPPPESG